MNVIYYSFPDDNFATSYVSSGDYQHLSDYCDHLVQFSKLPCLPKDLENLRNANATFAQENCEQQVEIKQLKNKIRAMSEEGELLKNGRNRATDYSYSLERKIEELEERNSALMDLSENLNKENNNLLRDTEEAINRADSLADQLFHREREIQDLKEQKNKSANEEYLYLLENRIADLESEKTSLTTTLQERTREKDEALRLRNKWHQCYMDVKNEFLDKIEAVKDFCDNLSAQEFHSSRK